MKIVADTVASKTVSTPRMTLNVARGGSIAATVTPIAAAETASIIAARVNAVAKEVDRERVLSMSQVDRAEEKKSTALTRLAQRAFRRCPSSWMSQRLACCSLCRLTRSTGLKKGPTPSIGHDRRLERVPKELAW